MSTTDEPGRATDAEELRGKLRAAEDRFRSIVEDTAAGLIVVDAGGVIRFANPAAGRLLGRAPRELEGSTFAPELELGGVTRAELGPAGREQPVELRAEATRWEGEPARVVALRPFPDRRRDEGREQALEREHGARVEAEQAAGRAEFLAEAARRLSSSLSLDEPLQAVVELVAREFADYCMLDIVDDGVHRFVAVREGVTEPRQDIVEAIRGHPLEPSAGTPQARAFADRRAVLVEEVDDDWLRDAAQDEAHGRVLARLRPTSVILVPLDSGRECLGLLHAVRTGSVRFRKRDLHLATELGRHLALAVENARLYRDAEAANQAKANFLSVMSHELRTPLSAIIGYTDLIDRGVVGEVTEKQAEYLHRIRASSSHLLQIIEEILAFAGTEAGKDSVQAEELTLAELMDAVAAVAEPLARQTDLEFSVDVEGGETRIITDQRKVRQVLLNLVSNALKFTQEGRVVVRARPDGDELVFQVEDTGVGIPRDKQDAIFERFWQMEEALTRSTGGTGLGLTVARSFATLLGGSLRVESEPGEGSTFTLRVPRILGA